MYTMRLYYIYEYNDYIYGIIINSMFHTNFEVIPLNYGLFKDTIHPNDIHGPRRFRSASRRLCASHFRPCKPLSSAAPSVSSVSGSSAMGVSLSPLQSSTEPQRRHVRFLTTRAACHETTT